MRTRKLNAKTNLFVTGLSLCWVTAMLWFASPLSHQLGFLILSVTELKILTLGYAVFLGLLCYPSSQNKKDTSAQTSDYLLAFAGSIGILYFLFFITNLHDIMKSSLYIDWIFATVGLILLLEATRRVLALPLALLAGLTLLIIAFLPDTSAQNLFLHYWFSTEAVFGVSLGIATTMLSFAVVIGSKLDYLGFGQQMIAKLYQLFIPTTHKSLIPTWLDQKFWAWAFTLLYLEEIYRTGTTYFGLQILLVFLIVTPYGLFQYWRIKTNREETPLINRVRQFFPIVTILTLALTGFMQSTLFLLLLCAPVSVYRARQSADQKEKPSLLSLLESSALGVLSISLTATALSLLLFLIGQLGHTIDLSAQISRSLLISLITVFGGILFLILRSSSRKVFALPVAFLCTILLILGLELIMFRLSPGLSAIHAIAASSLIVALSQLHAFFFPGKQDDARPGSLMDWFTLAGRNAVPVIIAAATGGIFIGAITQTGFLVHLFG
ncbi:hypothetical protein RYZ26_02840 [Terasakiella sp. A23]|uniref:hypothetical protein n=1 Tax=Terasakiella sp. FCG-A23 TaxID=3080561 RepID=UPI0029543D69|nr:hypothetical protein [Terasakiella sp. A23]MDV7338516.1 hypothetical protein [Terasakiella sp. A23]